MNYNFSKKRANEDWGLIGTSISASFKYAIEEMSPNFQKL